jgi:hypothetical protein
MNLEAKTLEGEVAGKQVRRNHFRIALCVIECKDCYAPITELWRQFESFSSRHHPGRRVARLGEAGGAYYWAYVVLAPPAALFLWVQCPVSTSFRRGWVAVPLYLCVTGDTKHLRTVL